MQNVGNPETKEEALYQERERERENWLRIGMGREKWNEKFVVPENYQKQVIFRTNINDTCPAQLLCKTGKLTQEFNWRDN